MSVSVIISYHEEGQLFLEECIEQIRSTIHMPHEIIVADDFSRIPLKPIKDVMIVRQPYRGGVGANFDLGVKHAQYDKLILTAADTRYIDNGWAGKLISEIEKHPQSLVCSACVGLNELSSCCNFQMHASKCLKCHNSAENNMDIEKRKAKKHPQTGATILIFHDQQSEPKKPKSFRNIIEAKWLSFLDGESKEIPCILGACYAITKHWYNYIDGFWGHRWWGSLEPYISLKSWLFGGSCRVVPECYTGHIYKTVSPHKVPYEILMYNKLLVATLLFPDSDRLIDFLGNNPFLEKAKRQFNANSAEILKKKEGYAKKTIVPMERLVELLKLDYRL